MGDEKRGERGGKSPQSNTEWNKIILETWNRQTRRQEWMNESTFHWSGPQKRLTYYNRQASLQPLNCTTRAPGDKHLHKNCTAELYHLWAIYRRCSYITVLFTVTISVYDCPAAQNHTAEPVFSQILGYFLTSHMQVNADDTRLLLQEDEWGESQREWKQTLGETPSLSLILPACSSDEGPDNQNKHVVRWLQ